MHITFTDCIFHFEPHEIVLKPKEKISMKIFFFLCEAKIIVGKVEMTVNNKVTKLLKLSAIGKIPFLKLRRTKLDFGEVRLLKNKSETVQITNLSEVAVGFKLRRINSICKNRDLLKSDSSKTRNKIRKGSAKSHIKLFPQKGALNPGEIFQITINYSPTIFDKYDYEEYLVEAESPYLSVEEETIKNLCIERWNRVAAKEKLINVKLGKKSGDIPSKEYFYDMNEMSLEENEPDLEKQGRMGKLI